jgi:hypothetical protein
MPAVRLLFLKLRNFLRILKVLILSRVLSKARRLLKTFMRL